jgi:hypothetical protein
MELEGKARFTKEALQVVGEIQDLPVSDDILRKRELLSALGLNHVLQEKELEIKPEFPFSDLPRGENQDQCNSGPIEPDNMQRSQGQNTGDYVDCPRLERGMDDDRTKTLKTALDLIWKKVDPWTRLIKKRSLKEASANIHIRNVKSLPILSTRSHRSRTDGSSS